MDKRSLLFLACVSISYFGLHAFFGSGREDKHQAYQTKAEVVRSDKAQAAEQERLSRTADLSEFLLAELFSDAIGREKVATALKIGNHYLTLAWKSQLPEKLYVPSEASIEVLTLATPPALEGDPVFYIKDNQSVPLELPSLPGFSDLQLLTFNGSNQIVLAQQRGLEILFPYEYLDQSAIAFVARDQTYLPVGVYDPSVNKVRAFKEFERLQSLITQKSVPLTAPADPQESFYVLQTDYQQLVFSTRGGSLAEINLPLKSSKDSKSVVKEIDIDRQILANSPQNAHFPLHPFSIASENGNTINQDNGSLGGYYPLLRRPILKQDGSEKNSVPPVFYALNIVSEVDDIANQNFRVTEFGNHRIKFEASNGRRRIVKTYTIPQERNGPYCFDLEIQIDGDATGLWLSSGVPDVELVGGSYAPQLKYQVKTNRGADVEQLSLPKNAPIVDSSISPYWISNCNGFLGLIIDPLSPIESGYKVQKIEGATLPTRLSLIDSAYNVYPPANYPGYTTSLPLKSGVSTFRIFAGPYDESLLKKLDELYDDPTTNYTPEYTLAISIQGWFSFISQPFSKFLFFLMQIFYSMSHSWAISIVLLTIALRAMMYPLNNWSIKSTIKMQEIGPRVKAVQERYKKDPRKAQLEVMNLYRESGVNPFSGCLPMLLQMPFLIGMFYMLKSSFPLRGAPFIPGWIDDLAAPDVLFSWGQPYWLIGNQFHLLPILTGLVMFIQGKMSQKLPKDPSQLTDAQRQQKMMGIMMAGLFTIMFYGFPSGLNIYFMFSTILGILQQKFLLKTVQTRATK